MELVRLRPRHAAQYRALMLHGYETEPVAFTATVAEREPLALDWWEQRVSDRPNSQQLVLGCFVEGQLVGVAGLRWASRTRRQHRARLFGTYVHPSYLRRGIGRALVDGVLALARERPGTLVVELSVTESNRGARALYESCGFVPYGVEPLANRVGTGFVSKVYMWRRVGDDGE